MGKSQPGSFADASQLFIPPPASFHRWYSTPGWFGNPIGRDKTLLQPLPAFEVFMLQDARIHGERSRTHGKLRLEHEGQRVAQILRPELGMTRTLKGLGVRSVTRHAVVQARSSRDESFGLGIVGAVDKAHE